MNLNGNLALLENAGLIRLAQARPDLEYAFRHGLVQEAAVTTLVKADSRALHLAVARTLETSYPERLTELAPRLGEHFAAAGLDEQALKYFTLAGGAAAGAFANLEAVEHYGRALALAKRAKPPQTESLQQIYLRYGRALELLDRYPAALGLYQEMEFRALELGDRVILLASLIAQTTVQSIPSPTFDPAQAQRLIDRAVELAQKLGDREAEVKISWQQTLLSMHTGRVADALTYGERTLALARQQGLHEQLAFALDDLSKVYLMLGRMTEARALIAEAEQEWRQLRNWVMVGNIVGMSAWVAYIEGDLDQASRLGVEAKKLVDQTGNLWGMASAGLAGLYLAEHGEVEEGIRFLADGYRLATSINLGFMMVDGAVHLALVHESLGAYERGLEYAQRALSHSPSADPATRSYVQSIVARLQAANGLLAEAEATLQARAETDLAGMYWPLAHYAWEAESLVALALGQWARALTVMDQAVSELRAKALRLSLVEALTLRGKALVGLGRRAEAWESFAEARSLAESIGTRRLLWPALAALARLAEANGLHAEAYELRRQARTILEYIADHITAPELRASLFGLPDAREVLGAA